MPRRTQPKHMRDFENMNKRETLDRVLLDFDKAKAFHKPYQDSCSNYYRIYRAKLLQEDIRVGMSNLFIPYSFANIETLKSKIINALFSERPFVSTKALNISDDAEAKGLSDNMNKFLQYQFEQKIKIIPKSAEILLEAIVCGVAVTQQSWEYKKKTVKYRENQTVSGKPISGSSVIKEKDVVIKDNPTLDLVPYDRFFPDPAGTTIEDCSYVAKLTYKTYRELLDMTEYDEKEVLKLKESEGVFNSTSTVDNAQLANTGVSNDVSSTIKEIELIEYFTDDWHVVIADRNAVLLSEPNPYFHCEKPFSKWELVPVSNIWWGVSLIEVSEHLQEELNTTRNQRIDNVALNLNKMHKVRRTARIEQSELRSRAGGVVYVDEMDDIEPLEFEDVTGDAYNEESVIKKDMDTVVGVHDINRGSGTDRRETATMASITDQNSGERFTTAIKLLEFGGFKDAVAQIIQLNRQFITEDVPYTTTGDNTPYESAVMTVDAIVGEYELLGLGKSIGYLTNRDVKQNQIINLLNVLSPYAAFLNIPEFITQVFKTFELKDVEGVVKTQEQVQQEQEQANAQAQSETQPTEQPMQPQGGEMESNAGMGGKPNVEQLITQVAQTISNETNGQIPPDKIAQLVTGVIQGNVPNDPDLQPLVQRILELIKQFAGGTM